VKTLVLLAAALPAASSGTHDSSNFIGVENPLDEGDRWYPLPGYSGFRKAGGLAIGRDFEQLSPNTNYSYRVRATDAAGNLGPYSNVASASTLFF